MMRSMGLRSLDEFGTLIMWCAHAIKICCCQAGREVGRNLCETEIGQHSMMLIVNEDIHLSQLISHDQLGIAFPRSYRFDVTMDNRRVTRVEVLKALCCINCLTCKLSQECTVRGECNALTNWKRRDTLGFWALRYLERSPFAIYGDNSHAPEGIPSGAKRISKPRNGRIFGCCSGAQALNSRTNACAKGENTTSAAGEGLTMPT
jgi:hypothetical protein